MFYVYVLESTSEDKQYIGYTNDIKKRVREHNLGLNRSTKRLKPWKLIYFEACLSLDDAKRRERYLKTSQGSRMLKLRLKKYFYEKNV